MADFQLTQSRGSNTALEAWERSTAPVKTVKAKPKKKLETIRAPEEGQSARPKKAPPKKSMSPKPENCRERQLTGHNNNYCPQLLKRIMTCNHFILNQCALADQCA